MAGNSREVNPDFLRILVLISLEVAQNSRHDHLMFFEKSDPDVSKHKSNDLNFNGAISLREIRTRILRKSGSTSLEFLAVFAVSENTSSLGMALPTAQLSTALNIHAQIGCACVSNWRKELV